MTMTNELPWTEDEIAAMTRDDALLDAAYRAEGEQVAREVARMRDVSTGAALAMLTELHGGDEDGGACPAPVDVVEVLSADGCSSITARVLCADGTVRVAVAAVHHYAGSYDCPPDYEVEYRYEGGAR